MKVIQVAYEFQPKNYEELISIKGVGPKTIRALTLISDLIYGTKASWEDPVKYSFAHGGKDGIPYPVDREVYDRSITLLEEMLNKSKIDYYEKRRAFARLSKL